MRKLFLSCLFLSISALSVRAGNGVCQDFRPSFDKSDYCRQVVIHSNPWFPLEKCPVHALGGPDVNYLKPRTADWWGEGMALCRKYGVTALSTEINEPQAWTGQWREMLDSVEKNRSPMKVGMFFGMSSKDKEAVIASMKKVLGGFRRDLKESPAVLRADGHPVMLVYNPSKFRPAVWGEIFAALDADFGRMVYLLDIGNLAFAAGREAKQDEAKTREVFERTLRDYLGHFDGISSYGNGTAVHFDIIRRVMHEEFPQKINEGQAHFNYTVHFHAGGGSPDLTKSWREHLDACFSTDPDSIMLTNLFDGWENSLVYPCYDREDFLLRYLEWRSATWRKQPFKALNRPELVVANNCVSLVGWRNLEFEVLAFPIDSAAKSVEISLDLCDASGRVLHAFPTRRLALDTFRAERFAIESTRFADERGLVPRLRYRWANREFAMNYGPMTVLDPSVRGYRMFFCRSTKNQLAVKGSAKWQMDDAHEGGTHLPRRHGMARFAGELEPVYQGEEGLVGSSRVGILRDNVEFYFQDEPAKGFGELTLSVPDPGDALHYYHLELRNRYGHRFRTLPVWETNGRREAKVKVPIWKEDGSVAEYMIEGARVPYWYYPMDEDGGRLLLDVSGYGHHGAVNGGGFGGGHLGYTGYNHYHNGWTSTPKASLFRRYKQGLGGLEFNGTGDYVMIMGGTAFPGACTYELTVRPKELGRTMGLIGTANNNLRIDLLADGTIEVGRRTYYREPANAKEYPKDLSFRGDRKLEAGKWARIAVTYDLRTVTLYVNRKPAGSMAVAPAKAHESLNHVVLGARCGWVWKPYDFFKGDITHLRIYGRNLSPDEFL